MGTVVKNDKMAVLSEQNEVIMHLTSGEKRRVETLINAVDKEPKQVQLEATIMLWSNLILIKWYLCTIPFNDLQHIGNLPILLPLKYML